MFVQVNHKLSKSGRGENVDCFGVFGLKKSNSQLALSGNQIKEKYSNVEVYHNNIAYVSIIKERCLKQSLYHNEH